MSSCLNKIQNNSDLYLFKIENLQIPDEMRKLYIVEMNEKVLILLAIQILIYNFFNCYFFL